MSSVAPWHPVRRLTAFFRALNSMIPMFLMSFDYHSFTNVKGKGATVFFYHRMSEDLPPSFGSKGP